MTENSKKAIKDLMDWMNFEGDYEEHPLEPVTVVYSSAQSAVFSLIPTDIACALAESLRETV